MRVHAVYRVREGWVRETIEIPLDRWRRLAASHHLETFHGPDVREIVLARLHEELEQRDEPAVPSTPTALDALDTEITRLTRPRRPSARPADSSPGVREPDRAGADRPGHDAPPEGANV